MRQGEVVTLVQSLLGSVPQEGHPQQIERGSSVLDQMLGMAGNQMASQAAGSPIGAFLAAQQSAAPGGEATGSPLDALLGGQGTPGGLSAALDQVLGAEQPQASGDAPPSPLAGLLGGQPGKEGPSGAQGGAGLEALLGAGGISGGGGAPASAGGLGDLMGALMGGGAEPGSGEGGGNWLQALLPAAMAFLQAKQAGAEIPKAAGQALLAMLGGGQVNPLQSGAPRPAAGGLIAQSLLQAAMNR